MIPVTPQVQSEHIQGFQQMLLIFLSVQLPQWNFSQTFLPKTLKFAPTMQLSLFHWQQAVCERLEPQQMLCVAPCPARQVFPQQPPPPP
jgi:hypothetical protein